ncbi:hypothetical protein, variant 1 [Exophiala xenobiotica]|nr:hypothetical protein, variant 1 [Exophiala xenobiotica]KIW51463.1 hypothetical protein, variant 1 [Exophiala xenobiotica]
MPDRDENPWSDISARLQNLRNLLNSERHLGADHQQAFEAIDREMDHQMAADRSAARERRRRDLEAHIQEQDASSVSENPPQTNNPSSLVRSRRRAFRPSERLQRYQRERLGQSSRTVASEAYISPSTASPSTVQPNNDRGERLRAKRRKLDDGTYEDEPRTFSYGHNGQVITGQLRMEIVSCDGGEYSDPHVPINSYPQNVLVDDTTVYCTKTNRCNLLFKHVGGMPFTLTKIVVKAPRAGFDAPIQEGLIFIAMDEDNLLDKTSQYDVRWTPKSRRLLRHRQDGYRPPYRPSHEYINSTRSPLRSINSSRYLNNPTEQDEDSESDTVLFPGFTVSITDPSDEEDAALGPPSPRPWQDDEYSLRSYVDRYRPTYLEDDRDDGLWSTSGDSDDGWDDPERERWHRQQPDEDRLHHQDRIVNLMRAQQIRDSDGLLGRRNHQGASQNDDGIHHRTSTPRRSGMRTSAPPIGAAESSCPADERSGRPREYVDETVAKSGRGDAGASSSTKSDTILPHARFFINKSKSSAAIRFDPPV